MSASLSLFQIESELLDLLRFREDIEQDAEITPAEQKASLEACDQQIRDYVTREVQKVDGITAYLRECSARAAALKAEEARIKELRQGWEARHDRLESTVIRVMQSIGKKVIEGAQSTLALKKNPASCDVRQPELLPDQYKRVTVTLTQALYNRVLAHLMTSDKGAPMFVELQECKTTPGEPMLAKIKDELKAGVGVPGAVLVDDKVRLEAK